MPNKNNNATINSSCPDCGTDIIMNVDISSILGSGTYQTAPTNRASMQPSSHILVYNITTEDIKRYVTAKCRQYAADTVIELVPKYIERKSTKYDSRKSYAYVLMAMSDSIVDKNKVDAGWYEQIGDQSHNIRIVDSIFKNLILKYRYDKKMIDDWLKSYSELEKLEKQLGITEPYLRNLKKFIYPQRTTTNNEEWIIFAASPENIIYDMLQNPSTNKVDGKMSIKDVYPITKDCVGFRVHVSPNEINTTENPHVRQILTGEYNKK